MPDPVTLILPTLILLPAPQGLALRLLRLHGDVRLYDGVLALGYGQIAGTVAIFGTLARRRVTLFDHCTLRPLASVWSNPVTGAYVFSGLVLSRKYLVLCDDYSQTCNAAVADWVTAEAATI